MLSYLASVQEIKAQEKQNLFEFLFLCRKSKGLAMKHGLATS